MSNLQGKIVMLSEAHGSLVEAISRTLMKEGATVVLATRRHAPEAYRMKTRLRFPATPGELKVLGYELDEPGTLPAFRNEVLEVWGGLDAFIQLSARSFPAFDEDEDGEWGEEFTPGHQQSFEMSRTVMGLLNHRDHTAYITVSSCDITDPYYSQNLGEIAQSFQFCIARKLARSSESHPACHNLVLSEGTHSDRWIHRGNVGEAITLLLDKLDWNKGHEVFSADWQERMSEPSENDYLGGT